MTCCSTTWLWTGCMWCLAVDRAGLVGEDGETHQGVFDVSYLNSVPGMRVYAPPILPS